MSSSSPPSGINRPWHTRVGRWAVQTAHLRARSQSSTRLPHLRWALSCALTWQCHPARSKAAEQPSRICPASRAHSQNPSVAPASSPASSRRSWFSPHFLREPLSSPGLALPRFVALCYTFRWNRGSLPFCSKKQECSILHSKKQDFISTRQKTRIVSLPSSINSSCYQTNQQSYWLLALVSGSAMSRQYHPTR